jgi:riboflavin kinase / FMN adenylyltransferase
MQVFESVDSLAPADRVPRIGAIGVFDGIHIGHQRILRRVVDRARSVNGESIVLSFFPHPQKVIASGSAPPLLQTFEQQAELLAAVGIDVFLRLPFTRRLSLKRPREFVEDILDRVGFKEIHVGGNFRFGHRRAGDFERLVELGEEFGFRAVQTEAVDFRGERVSSTRVRREVQAGRVALVKRLLGRPYAIRGTVVKGAQRGARLGFPTANLLPENELIPATGVYVSRARIAQGEFLGATNIGYRPTVQGYREPQPTVETHLLEFSGDLYGQCLEIEFCQRLREERRFDGLEALIAQVGRDMLWSARYARRTEGFHRLGGEF